MYRLRGSLGPGTCSREDGAPTNGTSFRVSDTRGLARRAKSRMNIRTTPTVPRKARTSDRSRHGPQLAIFSTREGSGMRPSYVQTWPRTVIVSAHKMALGPEKCSQTNRRSPGLSGMTSYPPPGSS
ncbi:unnamed protein product [Mycena citricolor]|uniref:Uncharacterized protein n=1 Tax=Mycena citricolor TaxID=2018698 RepID=A0AAD2HBM9_9AGAR|nr:unnamed protein product [Mycena citricolor]